MDPFTPDVVHVPLSLAAGIVGILLILVPLAYDWHRKHRQP